MPADSTPPLWLQLLMRAGSLALGLALLRDAVRGVRGRPLLVMNRSYGFQRVSGWGSRVVGVLSGLVASPFLLLAATGLW